jgi:hypothetical protein
MLLQHHCHKILSASTNTLFTKKNTRSIIEAKNKKQGKRHLDL